MVFTNVRSYARHKILHLLWKKYKNANAKNNSAFIRSLKMKEIQSSLCYLSSDLVFDQVVYLEVKNNVERIIETSGQPAYYIIKGEGIESLQDKTHLKNGRRWILKKENLKFIYGITTGIVSNEILRVLFLNQKGFVHDMLTTLKILE